MMLHYCGICNADWAEGQFSVSCPSCEDQFKPKCKLCGVHCTTDECDTCKQIPQSHPYRNRVPERIVTDLCNGPLEVQTVEERNKYRRTS